MEVRVASDNEVLMMNMEKYPRVLGFDHPCPTYCDGLFGLKSIRGTEGHIDVDSGSVSTKACYLQFCNRYPS